MANMLFIEDAEILFKNFSGKETDYTDEGVRGFSVVIPDSEMASQLSAEGWNIKPLKLREGETEQRYSLPVAVRFDNFPPKITAFMGGAKGQMNEENVGELDYQKIIKADVYIAPSHYIARTTGEERIKAYLRSMAVFIELDPISAKYNDMFIE